MPNNNNTDPLWKRLEDNERKPCVNCGSNRAQFSRFCSVCKWRFTDLGNPNAKGIVHRSEYQDYVGFAEKIIQAGIDSKHEGILKALIKIDRWMTGEVFCLCSDVLKAQRAKGVQAIDLLAEITGLFLFYQLHQTKEMPSLRFQIGASIVRYKRASSRKVSYLEKKHLGANLFDIFLPLMRSIYRELKKEIEAKKREVEMFSVPIVEQVQ